MRAPATARPTRRHFLRLSGAAAAAGTLAACGSGGGSGGAALSFMYMGTAQQQKVWKKLFEEFRKQHADIQLEATGSPVDNWAAFFDKVSTQIAGGVIPDVLQVAPRGCSCSPAAACCTRWTSSSPPTRPRWTTTSPTSTRS